LPTADAYPLPRSGYRKAPLICGVYKLLIDHL
jgi:hypothetical protein